MDSQQPSVEPAASQAADPPPRYFEARAELAYRYLAGEGLEIGALNWPLRVPPWARTKNVDRMTPEQLREEYPEWADVTLAAVDIVDDGERLESIDEGSQDFIVANHFLEHTDDPIGTIERHLGRLKPGGILFYAVPDKRYTFDFRRQVTTLEHLIRDHEEGPGRSRRAHYDEWAGLVAGTEADRQDPHFTEHAEEAARKLEADDYSIHHHTWTDATFLEMLLHCRSAFEEGFEIEVSCRRELEIVVVLRKAGALPEPAAPAATAPELAVQVSQLERELEKTGRELRHVKQSPSWRVTEPLRSARRDSAAIAEPAAVVVRAAVYIPNFNGERWLPRTLQSLRDQTERLDVIVVDNGSTDASIAAARTDFPEVTILELGENLGFGPALNRAVASHPADGIVLLNADVECRPTFCGTLVAGLEEGIDMVAALLLQERAPGLIDSAGVVADRTLMGFDYLHGESVAAAAKAADPLGPTGGAGLYRRAAWEAVGGFDERIFLYYEDLDLALRIAAGGGRCRLAPEARALHAYSAGLGAASSAKYARTGWSRGYMLRRYGVMRDPRLALRALACEAAIGAGQLLRDRTAAGIKGRLQGFRAAANLSRREVGGAPLSDISAGEALALRRRRRG